ncbi:hypothetical protein CTI14_72505, partial [Methylobacterium radiotolerans]
PAWLLRIGLFLYDHLGGRKRLPGTRPVNLSGPMRPAWLLRIGLFLYDHLGGRKRLPGTRPVNLSGP